MSQKIISITLILFLVLVFGLVVKPKVTQAQLTCANTKCEAANTGVTCLCGTTLTSFLKPWCCAAVNGVYASQPQCQKACSAVSGGGGGGGTPKEVPTLDVIVVLNNIVNWLFAILLIIAALFIILAGYYFVTSAGDPERAKVARNYVFYCIIGVAVAFLSKGLIRLVERIVTGT